MSTEQEMAKERATSEIWNGRPARVHVFDRENRERLVARVPGSIERLKCGRLHLELLSPVDVPWSETQLVVEVLLSQALVRFDAQALPDSPSGVDCALEVAVPTHVDSLQRRQHSRVDVSLAATVIAPHAKGESAATLVSLSAGGLAVIVPEALEVGSVIRVSFCTDDGTRYDDLHGEVLRTQRVPEGYRTALQFVNISAETVVTLTHYVNQLHLAEMNGNLVDRSRW